MKKIVRLTESDLIKLVKRVINEEPMNQDSLTNYKNELLLIDKELDIYIKALNEMIPLSKNLDVEFKISSSGTYRTGLPSDYDNKTLYNFLIEHLKSVNYVKKTLKEALHSFDVNIQKESVRENLKSYSQKRLLWEMENPLKKYIPIIDKFIKSCDRFYDFDYKNRMTTDFGPSYYPPIVEAIDEFQKSLFSSPDVYTKAGILLKNIESI